MRIDMDLLRLDFGPQSVREHFEDTDLDISFYTNAELAEAAEQMLSEDPVWNMFDDMMNRIIEICEESGD